MWLRSRNAVVALVLVLASAAVARAQTNPFTGKWEGTFVQANGSSNPMHLDLTQTDKGVTGTAGNANRQWPIENGEVKDGKATFEMQQGGALHRFSLTLVNGKLQGEMRSEVEGQTHISKVEAEKKVVAVASADGFGGKWEGTFVEANGDSNPIQLNLTQSGKALSGTMGPNATRQWAIEKGEVNDAKATFEVRQGGALSRFTLTLEKDKLQGEMRTEIDGRTLVSKVAATRAK